MQKHGRLLIVGIIVIVVIAGLYLAIRLSSPSSQKVSEIDMGVMVGDAQPSLNVLAVSADSEETQVVLLQPQQG